MIDFESPPRQARASRPWPPPGGIERATSTPFAAGRRPGPRSTHLASTVIRNRSSERRARRRRRVLRRRGEDERVERELAQPRVARVQPGGGGAGAHCARAVAKAHRQAGQTLPGARVARLALDGVEQDAALLEQAP